MIAGIVNRGPVGSIAFSAIFIIANTSSLLSHHLKRYCALMFMVK